MKKLLALMLLLNVHFCFSQKLTTERIQRIKTSTVKITIEGVDISGSGFFFDENGSVLTCFHVIQPSISVVLGAYNLKKIFVTNSLGIIKEYGIRSDILLDSNIIKGASLMDFSVLVPVTKNITKTPYLNLISMNELPEGGDIYACGFPFGGTQFISRGILSTKYTDTPYISVNSNIIAKDIRQVALLDLTLNPGNSGGPIVKFGDTEDKDGVIGIADFIVNPIGPMVGNLTKMFSESAKNGYATLMGIDPVKMYNLFTQLFANTSVGISGCVSIDEVARVLGWKKN